MSFTQAHGSWNIYVSQQTLVIHTAGAWNTKAMELFSLECKKAVQPLIERGQAWSSLVLLDDYELGVLDIEPLLKSLLDWLTDHGLTHEAAVFDGGFARTEQMARNLPQHKQDYVRENFSSVSQAVSWLQSHGYCLESEQIDTTYRQWRINN